MNIDYTKLNERIVEQAYNNAGGVLTEAQKKQLFQNKIERARQMLEARGTVYHLIED